MAVAVGTARTAGNRLPSRVFLLEFYFVTLVHTNLCKPNRCVTNRVLTGCRWCKGTLGKHWCRPRLPENQFSWCRPRPLERQVERRKGEETSTPPFGMPGTQRHRREGETGQAGPYHCSQSPRLDRRGCPVRDVPPTGGGKSSVKYVSSESGNFVVENCRRWELHQPSSCSVWFYSSSDRS